jgi:hypothetical protein
MGGEECCARDFCEQYRDGWFASTGLRDSGIWTNVTALSQTRPIEFKQRRRRQVACAVAEAIGLPAAILSMTLVCAAGELPAASSPPKVSAIQPLSAVGPTLDLDYGTGAGSGNPLAEFMYFVPLIAPEPVAISQSPGNTQRARVVSATRRFTGKTFLVTYEYEFVGAGDQHNILDHREKIHLHETEFKAGRSLDEQLQSINIIGGGDMSIEAEGTIEGSTTNVTEVRLRFNARSRQSPVTIGIHDLKYVDGRVVSLNEVVARVNSLTFKKQSGQPKMELSIASIRPKDAADSAWQNFVGRVKGGAVNFFIKPIAIRRVGNQAMLDFGQALASRAGAFTFPRAANLLTPRQGVPTVSR